jgi:hypothetical protein
MKDLEKACNKHGITLEKHPHESILNPVFLESGKNVDIDYDQNVGLSFEVVDAPPEPSDDD